MTKPFKNSISKIKICKWAILFNGLIALGMIAGTIFFILLGTSDLQGSTKYITIGVNVAFVLLDLLTILAFRGFINNNNLTKIYFMLLSIFGFPFALGYGIIGGFVMVFLLISLFLNIGCYRKVQTEN